MRQSGQTAPAQPGGQPGNFNQNITAAQTAWTQQLEIALTPWGFLKGAAANNATARTAKMNGKTYNVVSYSPSQKAPSGQAYTVTGYINEQNEIERVETRVEHPILGDLLVENLYSTYQPFGALKVPTKITQRRAGFNTFDATITSATANPPNITELLTPPPAPGRAGGAGAPGAAAGGRAGGPPPPPAVETQKLGDGLFRITGGYVAIAADMGDHIVILEGGQSEQRGLAIIDAAKKAIPGKPIRFVVNTHPHFDHGSGPGAVRRRRRDDHHPREQRGISREGAQQPAHTGRRHAGQGAEEGQGRRRRGQESAQGRRQRDRAVSRARPRTQRRHARRLHPEAEDPAVGRLQLPGGECAASTRPAGVRDLAAERRSPEAGLRRVHSGPRAESGSAADEGGRAGVDERHELTQSVVKSLKTQTQNSNSDCT
jgi:hypothetical protein